MINLCIGIVNRTQTTKIFLSMLLICLFLGTALTGTAQAQEQSQPLILMTDTPAVQLQDKLKIFSNVPDETGFQEMVSRYRRSEGVTPPTGQVILKSSENTHWLFFSVFNQDRFNQQWLLNLGDLFDGTYGYINKIEAYDFSSPQKPFVIDGRKSFNKTQPAAQRKNVIPLNVSVSELKIFGIKIIATPGSTIAFTPTILTHAGYQDVYSQGRGHDFTLLLIFAFLLILCVISGLTNRKALTYVLMPYILLHGIFLFARDELVSYGNNSAVLLIPFITYVILSFFVFFTALISLEERYNYFKKFAGMIFAAAALFGLYISFASNTHPLVESMVLFWLPYLWLGGGLILATFIFLHIDNKKAGLILIVSALALCASHLISAWAMHEVEHAGQIFALLITIHIICYLLYTHIHFMSVTRAERLEAEAEMQKTQQAIRQKEQQKTADQEKLVNILQRERELLAELKEREAERAEAMRHAKLVADEANRAKSAFLAVISHEIRTPMTGIMGMIRLLLDSNLKGEQQEYAETIQYSGDALLALLNDILDFSKIEEGRMEIENVSFDIRKMLESVIMLMSGRAKERKIDLKLDITNETPEFLKGDPTRLRQVLLNLIGNAIKFTEDGSVTIVINTTERDDGAYDIYFGVQDTGIGITKEAQKNLFNPFSQADSSISRRFGGTGLGLAICKRLVTAMGGDIKIESAPGKGSLFFFTLPMFKGQKAEEREIATQRQATDQLKILVADDNEINQKVLIGLLSKDQHTVIAVSNGEEAAQAVIDEEFDLVLMDMEMPVMNGIEATQKIRGLADRDKSMIPIVAMTANVIKEDIEKCKQAGMNDYVSKPIDPDKLRSVITAAHMHEGAFQPARRSTDKVKSQIDPNIHNNAKSPEEQNAVPDLFDKEMLGTLKESLGVDVLDEMMQDLYTKADELIDELEKAFAEGNYTDLRGRAHDLKGMMSNFGLTGISELAAPIESGAREEKPLAELEKSVTKLRPTYKSLRKSLKKWFEE